MSRTSRMTQFLWLLAVALLGLAQLGQAVTTANPKAQVASSTVKQQQQQQQQQQQGKQDPKCLQPLETGPCRMSLERYYYNKEKNSCETFKYGGCRGNDNRFGFRQSCEEACLVRK